MVHAEKDWAFIALCDYGSLWLYHGSWSRIEGIPQTTNVERFRRNERIEMAALQGQPTRQRIGRGADPRRGFRSGGRRPPTDRPIHRAVRAARRPARVRGKRGAGTGLPVRVA
jgi:hypothetical protein